VPVSRRSPCRSDGRSSDASSGSVAGHGRGRRRGVRRRPGRLAVAVRRLQPRVLPDRPEPVRVLRLEDRLRRGGWQRLADSGGWWCVYARVPF